MKIAAEMQEETTDEWGRLHIPHCTIARDDRRIVHMVVMDPVATSRTIAQQIQSVTYHSLSVYTIRRYLPQILMSLSHLLLCLSLTGVTGISTAKGTMNGGKRQRNGLALHLLLNPASVCNITTIGLQFGDTMLRDV
ncbi:hypothetical protein TNCV_356531 [Trichonephila clavipes]|nr:hypothetical protein TNCV_356531 [Trichonephila clavipes]